MDNKFLSTLLTLFILFNIQPARGARGLSKKETIHISKAFYSMMFCENIFELNDYSDYFIENEKVVNECNNFFNKITIDTGEKKYSIKKNLLLSNQCLEEYKNNETIIYADKLSLQVGFLETKIQEQARIIFEFQSEIDKKDQEQLNLKEENVKLNNELDNIRRELLVALIKIKHSIVMPIIGIPLPEEAPEKWEDYKKNNPDVLAVDFFKRVYKKWIDSKSIYQNDLSGLGEKILLKEMKNYYYRNNFDISEVLPSKKVKTRMKLDAIDWNNPFVKELISLNSLRSQNKSKIKI